MGKRLIILGDESNIDICMVSGHVTTKEFNEVYLKNFTADPVKKIELKHEYRKLKKVGKRTRYFKAEKGEKGARPYTAVYW